MQVATNISASSTSERALDQQSLQQVHNSDSEPETVEMMSFNDSDDDYDVDFSAELEVVSSQPPGKK
jgi:hypothetical protein